MALVISDCIFSPVRLAALPASADCIFGVKVPSTVVVISSKRLMTLVIPGEYDKTDGLDGNNLLML